jgi:hypothetical protein
LSFYFSNRYSRQFTFFKANRTQQGTQNQLFVRCSLSLVAITTDHPHSQSTYPPSSPARWSTNFRSLSSTCAESMRSAKDPRSSTAGLRSLLQYFYRNSLGISWDRRFTSFAGTGPSVSTPRVRDTLTWWVSSGTPQNLAISRRNLDAGRCLSHVLYVVRAGHRRHSAESRNRGCGIHLLVFVRLDFVSSASSRLMIPSLTSTHSHGVIQPFRELGWWKWMYRVSPYTYMIEVNLLAASHSDY